MINMGYQPEYGSRVSREIYAEGPMAYYSFAMRGVNPTGVTQATARAAILGLVVPSMEGFRPDGNGGIVPRTEYVLDEIPDVLETGVAWVQLGSGVSNAVPGNEVMSDASGYAVLYTAPTVTLSDTTKTDDSSAITAAISAAINENKVKAGKLIDGGSAGDIVRMKLYGDD
jgi:hypothetical protein